MSRLLTASSRARAARHAAPIAASAALIATLSGCAAAVDATVDATVEAEPKTQPTTEPEIVVDPSYRDGSFRADGAYQSPAGDESIIVVMQLENDIVTDVEIGLYPTSATSSTYQDLFAGGIAEKVIGTDIDDLDVTVVAGSSLTSIGFRAAVDTIKAEALDD
ncbi:MAG: hypothetical protein C0444_07865 [Microbacterium sp.]|nr:hypothetical protein [Microbacterium sp.]MBA4345985.1 hypothetical protein [Microbacterium sp.]